MLVFVAMLFEIHIFSKIFLALRATYGHGLWDKTTRRGNHAHNYWLERECAGTFFLPRNCAVYSFFSPRFPPTQPQAEAKNVYQGKSLSHRGRVECFLLFSNKERQCEANAKGKSQNEATIFLGGEMKVFLCTHQQQTIRDSRCLFMFMISTLPFVFFLGLNVNQIMHDMHYENTAYIPSKPSQIMNDMCKY